MQHLITMLWSHSYQIIAVNKASTTVLTLLIESFLSACLFNKCDQDMGHYCGHVTSVPGTGIYQHQKNVHRDTGSTVDVFEPGHEKE